MEVNITEVADLTEVTKKRNGFASLSGELSLQVLLSLCTHPCHFLWHS